MTATITAIDASTKEFREAADALDRHQLQRIQSDLETMMLRHGRKKIAAIFMDALKKAEIAGAEW